MGLIDPARAESSAARSAFEAASLSGSMKPSSTVSVARPSPWFSRTRRCRSIRSIGSAGRLRKRSSLHQGVRAAEARTPRRCRAFYGQYPRARARGCELSLRDLGRHAATRDDRHGALLPARYPDRRRAHHGSRCYHAGADPARARCAGDRPRRRRHPDHPRPWHRFRVHRPDPRHVCRHGLRGRADRPQSSPSRSILTRGPFSMRSAMSRAISAKGAASRRTARPRATGPAAALSRPDAHWSFRSAARKCRAFVSPRARSRLPRRGFEKCIAP